MKIVLATPLYPPDTAESALYVKELAGRLSKSHQVVIVTYGRLPEKIPGVSIVAIDKRQPIFSRLSAFTRALLKEVRGADLLYVLNGASVEFPAFVVRLLSSKPLLFCIADTRAHQNAKHHISRHVLERIISSHAKHVVSDIPPSRPEILPLEAYPTAAFEAYEASWRVHIDTLHELFTHGN